MTQSGSGRYWKLSLALFLAVGGVITFVRDCAFAQISPDTTLKAESSVVKPNVVINGVPSDQIDGGARRGANLFHSFLEFNVDEGRGAYFTNPAGVENILSRVTGGNSANILGTLGVTGGNANLFLLNPNGIIFGPNASLAIGGSFVASTASSINFQDGTNFSATVPQTQPLLTLSVPIGLQFGAYPGSILNQSQPPNGALNGFGLPAGLQVQAGKTLALVGGDILLESGNITAEGGRIELGSVAGSGLVSLTSIDQGIILGYEGIQNFQDIKLTQRTEFPSFVTTQAIGAENAGDININTRNLIVQDGAQISTRSFGVFLSEQGQFIPATGRGGNLTVNASESVKLIGTSSSGEDVTTLASATSAAGDAGDITINTGRLLLHNGARLLTESSGVLLFEQFIPATGRAGNLTANASESVELIGTSSSGTVSTLSSATVAARGAGDLKINTGRLLIQNGAEVTVSSLGTGDAGNLEVTAGSILMDSEGKLTATSTSGKAGGNIRLQALDLLLMRRSNEISTSAGGTGNGGDITIDTDLLVGLENSDITANAFEGEGGFIQITAQGIFGLEVNETNNISELRRNTSSDISAASKKDPSLNGEVEINTPDEFSSGVVALPPELVDVSELIAQGCSAGGGTVARESSKFIATGRGGLPPTPTEALRSDPALADLGTPIQGDRDRASATISTNPTNFQPVSIVEAQGWMIGPQGDVVLTAHAPSVTPHIPWMPQTSCNGF